MVVQGQKPRKTHMLPNLNNVKLIYQRFGSDCKSNLAIAKIKSYLILDVYTCGQLGDLL